LSFIFMGIFSQFSVARELLQQGDLEQSLAEVDRVVGLFGKSVEALELQVEIRGAIVAKNRSPEEEAQIWYNRLRSKAVDCNNSGQYEKALELVEEFLTCNPHDSHAWYVKGYALHGSGCYEGAVVAFDVALSCQCPYYATWNNRGITLDNLGQYEAAIKSYDRALVIKPDDWEAWNNRGVSLVNLGQYEAAIASFDQALQIKPNHHEAWSNRGMSLVDLGQYEAAIASYDNALAIKPDDQEAWNNRGGSLSNLGQYEAAITCFDQALQIKPDYHNAWLNRGVVLRDLGQYEAAITCFDQALQIKPDYAATCYGRGITLINLGQYEAAITCFDQALQIKPDYYDAWFNRGIALANLGQYEAAITCFDQALQLKPDYYDAWFNRGIALANLGQYEAAIACFDQALKVKLDDHQAWVNRGTAFCLLSNVNLLKLTIREQIRRQNLERPLQKSHIEALREALPHIPQNTIGFGEIHLALGDAYLKHNRSSNPRPQWRDAKRSYNIALKNLPETTHRKDYLSALWGFCHTSLLVDDETSLTLDALLRKGTEICDRLILEAHPDQQDELSRTLPNFNELTVDFHLSQGDNIAAIETAEADKNGLMQWLLPVPGTANYAEMRETIGPDTAIVYWYLGANAIATFVIRADQVEPIVVTEFDREISLKTRDRLDEWIKTWNKNYTVHRQKSKESNISKNSDWQNTLPTELESLAEILNIPALLPHLQNIQNLILVPHRDLHRFPLHSFFPKTNITHLPSLHLGRHLRPAAALTPNLLNVVAPDHADLDPLPDAAIESHTLDRMLKIRQITTTQLTQATHHTLTQALTQPHNILHFNGHAGYNDTNPKLSSLGLQGDDRLTTTDLTKLPSLSHYNLITLTSCETAITGNQTITAEYVGLVSGFLGHGIPHILSTLWTIESAASALFILQFYRQILKGKSPAQALTHSQTWMRTVTNRQLHRHYGYWIDRRPKQGDRIRPLLRTERIKLGTMEPQQTPYSHPYYWAAFILSGRG
jgi:tetratricopeptide (TPR) repeat protein/CHAT domain-containing protein